MKLSSEVSCKTLSENIHIWNTFVRKCLEDSWKIRAISMEKMMLSWLGYFNKHFRNLCKISQALLGRKPSTDLRVNNKLSRFGGAAEGKVRSCKPLHVGEYTNQWTDDKWTMVQFATSFFNIFLKVSFLPKRVPTPTSKVLLPHRIDVLFSGQLGHRATNTKCWDESKCPGNWMIKDDILE